jgi:hypothetical protein
MTTIFLIQDPINQTINFICDSQATIDSGKALNIEETYSVGTEADAKVLFNNTVNTWLTKQIKDGVFNVQKEEPVENGVSWSRCDLSTEPPNTDTVYQLLNVPSGNWISATGLDAAKQLQTQIQQQYLTWFGLGSLKTLTEWPKPTTTGTQTL